MKCLVVVAHPIPEALCHTLARHTADTLTNHGHSVEIDDLYASGFAPSLTHQERSSYYTPNVDTSAVETEVTRLRAAEALVLVFPTWWFGFPAILKGWFDRVWAPGVAYDHASDLGAIRPRLEVLRHALAITSLGSPWWVDHFILRRPVRRVLKSAILGTCSPSCRFEMLSLYRAESLSTETVKRFCYRIDKAVSRWQ